MPGGGNGGGEPCGEGAYKYLPQENCLLNYLTSNCVFILLCCLLSQELWLYFGPAFYSKLNRCFREVFSLLPNIYFIMLLVSHRSLLPSSLQISKCYFKVE